jgi:cobalt-zinc-cadmium efflux system outer membrane protein
VEGRKWLEILQILVGTLIAFSMRVRLSILLFLTAILLMPARLSAQVSGDMAQSQSHVSPASQPNLQTGPTGMTGGSTSLTIERALALAEQNSPLLRQGAASVERAQAGIQTARTYTNPTVEFLAGHQSARPVATPGVPGFLQHYSAGQTIEIPRERRSRIRAAQLELTGNTFQLAGIRLSVMASVQRAFYDVLRRKEQLANAKGNFSLVEDLRRRVGVEVQVGEKGKLELTRAEAELARARAAVNSAEVELSSSRAILKAVIGVPSEENPDPQGVLDHRAQLAPLEDLRRQVLEAHPALSEATARTAQAQEIVTHERARRIPEPNLYGEYERQPDQTFFRLGVSVPLPLWDQRKGPIAEAQAEVARSQAISRQRQLEIMAALERAYDQYQITDQQVQGLQAGSLREAQAAVDAASSAYRFGERGIVEVLDAQRVLQGVRTDLLDALFARQSALIDLEELGAVRQ